jgi:3-oxoacyl-[acyl-carrier protein] reductase
MLHREARGDSMTPEVQQALLGPPTPIARLGTTDEIAAACAFLVSDEAAFITGQVLAVNGGWYM